MRVTILLGLACAGPAAAWPLAPGGVAPASPKAGRPGGLFGHLRARHHHVGLVATSASPSAPAQPAAPAEQAPAVPLPYAATSAADTIAEGSAVAAADATAAAQAGGFQALPPVASMLGGAAETLRAINSQASILEARISQGQVENEAKMARQKAVLEQKLKAQDDANQAVVAENLRIGQAIRSLQAGNVALRQRAKALQGGNRFKRLELKALQAKLTQASHFVEASLKAASDRGAKELAVLQVGRKAAPPAPKLAARSQDAKEESDSENDEEDSSSAGDSDEDEDSDGDDAASPVPAGGASLLAMSSRVRRGGGGGGGLAAESEAAGQLADVEVALAGLGATGAPAAPANPADLLTKLSAGVADLARQEKAGEERMRQMFLASFKAGTERKHALELSQKQANATRAQLEGVQGKLKLAVAHLEGTKAVLEHRLHGVGAFLQQLGGLAVAPAKEAPRLLKALPPTVTPEPQPAAADSLAA